VRVEVEKVVLPLLNGIVPRFALPSLNVTEPVALIGLTVASRLTVCPAVTGLDVAARVVEVEVVAALITSLTGADVLVALLESPLYDAVSVRVPTARLEVVSTALPPLVTAAVPRLTVPSWNVMLPVALAGNTMAVRVTGWPAFAGLGKAAMPVVVGLLPAAAATVTVTAREALPLKAVSPLYAAVRERVPAARMAVDSEAIPPVTFTVPIAAPPSLKVTVPVALEGVTVAVKVTVWPAMAEAGDAASVVVDVALVCPA
jgi:hypothetical protein